MSKLFLGLFDKRPLIWFHYVLLTLVLWGGYFLGNFLIGDNFSNVYVMLTWFFVVLSIGDQLIHRILGVN